MTNSMPREHRKVGEQIADTIVPLDEMGKANPKDGRIGAIVIGHSNTGIYFRTLSAQLVDKKEKIPANESAADPRFMIVSACRQGCTTLYWTGMIKGPGSISSSSTLRVSRRSGSRYKWVSC